MNTADTKQRSYRDWADKQVAHWESQFDKRLRDFMFESKDDFSAKALSEFASKVSG